MYSLQMHLYCTDLAATERNTRNKPWEEKRNGESKKQQMSSVPLGEQQEFFLLHNKEVSRCCTCLYRPPTHTHKWPLYACVVLEPHPGCVCLLYYLPVVLFHSRIWHLEVKNLPMSWLPHFLIDKINHCVGKAVEGRLRVCLCLCVSVICLRVPG